MIIDVEILRVILIVLGGFIVLMIYLWERLRKDDAGEIGWRDSHLDTTEQIGTQDTHYSISNELTASSEITDKDNQTRNKKLDEVISYPMKSKERCKREDENADYWQAGAPQLVLQLNISSKGDLFNGPQVLKALEKVGCQVNERGIFNYCAPGETDALFSVVSMVKPGIIPMQELNEFKTPGLTMFADLSGVTDGIALFSLIVSKAKIVAAELGGEVQDDSHSRLTNQIIEHIHSQILEYQRQMQLISRRCGKI